MGCDGGTIPRRDELVRLKKKPEQKDKDAERTFKWRNCALTQQTLQEPVVACGIGRLYTKSSVLEALLDKETKPESIQHIKNMKDSIKTTDLECLLTMKDQLEALGIQHILVDIKDLKLTKNPAYSEAQHTEGAAESCGPYICPISGLEMTGKFRFVFLWSCGCVLAERALKEVKQNICHMCQHPFSDIDVVVLNGTEEDVEKMRRKMATRTAGRKSKKSDKSGKTEIKEEPSANGAPALDVKDEPQPGGSGIKKEMDTIPLSLPKFNPNKQARGHFGSSKRAFTTQLEQDPSYKKSKKDYSVAKDPKTSEVYKSLFTSHQSDKEQQRAHWVTYNPFYN